MRLLRHRREIFGPRFLRPIFQTIKTRLTSRVAAKRWFGPDLRWFGCGVQIPEAKSKTKFNLLTSA
jgi:hypothetical protein